jgi:hypothetical protein
MPTGTLGTSARDYHTRQTMYIATPLLASSAGNTFTATATVKIGTIPAGATIVRIAQYTQVVNNAATSALVSLGTVASGTDFVATGAAGMVTLGPTAITVPATSATVGLLTDLDIWVTNKSTGTAATTGVHQFSVDYIIP